MTSQVLPVTWFTRPTSVVAADLVGKLLCRRTSDGIIRVRISETEAYVGLTDPACYAHAGTRSTRTEPMYQMGGIFYVYLTYGIHHMLNLVSAQAESPESVLIRAAFDDPDLAQPNSSTQSATRALAGPGKLTKQLHIDRDLNAQPIAPASGLWVENDDCQPSVLLRPRIGIDYAGEGKHWLLRFVWQAHPSLSKP